jgi:serine/threonine protein kinase
MASPTSSAEFLDLVRKSGVLEDKRLDAHLEKLRAAGAVPEEPAKLAGILVRDGLLTNFQAEQIMLGKWRRFTLGKYKVLERIGGGGMGSVYLCEHKLMRRRVAVKVLPTAKASDPSALERFYREARAAAALDHPNIVHAYDIDQDENLHFLVMEYVDGSSFQEIAKKSGPLDPVRAAHYIAEAARGLHHAHVAGLVHRDIKPGNILVDRSGTVKLLDMGLARFFNDEDDILTKKYDENVLGTADYLAPEQALDSHGVDIRADIYSLGATFYFILTGRTPFSEGTVAQKLIWHQTRQPKSIRVLRPEVPEPMVAIVERMMAKDPAQRYQVPLEVARALEPWTDSAIPPPSEAEMPRLSPAASGLFAAEPSSAAPAPSTVPTAVPPPAPRKTKSWQVPLTPAAPPSGPKTPEPRGQAGATSRTARVAAVPTAVPAPDLQPTMVSRPGPQPALAPAPEPAADDDSIPWERLASETGGGLSRADTSERSSRKNLRPRPGGKSGVYRLSERQRFWLVAGGASAVVLLCLFLLLGRFVFAPSPKVRSAVRPVLRVNKIGRAGEFKTIMSAVQRARAGDRIVIAGGEYEERLVLRDKKDIAIEAGEGEVKVIPPKAPGPGNALVTLENTRGLELRGLKLAGQDRTRYLVVVVGTNPGLLLEQLRLVGFTGGGVELSNCEGEDVRPIQLRGLVFVAKDPKAAKPGVVFHANPRVIPTRDGHIHIQNCAFEGNFGKVRRYAFDPERLGPDVQVDGKSLRGD